MGARFLELLLDRVWQDTDVDLVVNEFEDERHPAVAVHRRCGIRPSPQTDTGYGRATRRWILSRP